MVAGLAISLLRNNEGLVQCWNGDGAENDRCRKGAYHLICIF